MQVDAVKSVSVGEKVTIPSHSDGLLFNESGIIFVRQEENVSDILGLHGLPVAEKRCTEAQQVGPDSDETASIGVAVGGLACGEDGAEQEVTLMGNSEGGIFDVEDLPKLDWTGSPVTTDSTDGSHREL